MTKIEERKKLVSAFGQIQITRICDKICCSKTNIFHGKISDLKMEEFKAELKKQMEAYIEEYLKEKEIER